MNNVSQKNRELCFSAGVPAGSYSYIPYRLHDLCKSVFFGVMQWVGLAKIEKDNKRLASSNSTELCECPPAQDGFNPYLDLALIRWQNELDWDAAHCHAKNARYVSKRVQSWSLIARSKNFEVCFHNPVFLPTYNWVCHFRSPVPEKCA